MGSDLHDPPIISTWTSLTIEFSSPLEWNEGLFGNTQKRVYSL